MVVYIGQLPVLSPMPTSTYGGIRMASGISGNLIQLLYPNGPSGLDRFKNNIPKISASGKPVRAYPLLQRLSPSEENKLADAEKILSTKGLDPLVYEDVVGTIRVAVEKRTDLVTRLTPAWLEKILNTKDLHPSVYRDVVKTIRVVFYVRSELAIRSTLTSLEKRLNTKYLLHSDYACVVETIRVAVEKRPDLVTRSTLASLEKILNTKDLDPLVYQKVVETIRVAVEKRPDLVTRSTLASLEKILNTKDLDYWVYRSVVKTIRIIVEKGPKHIVQSTPASLEKALKRKDLRLYAYEFATEIAGACCAKLGQPISPALLKSLKLRAIQFRDGGNAIHDVSSFAQGLLKGSRPLELKPLPEEAAREFPRKEFLSLKDIPIDLRNSTALKTMLQDYTPHRIHEDPTFGRTVIYRHREKEEYLALKLLKEEENPGELLHEYRMLGWVNRWKEGLGLKSDYPIPVPINGLAVARVSESLLPKIEGFQHFTDKSGREVKIYRKGGGYILTAYKTTSPDYFTYWNDPKLTEEEFEEAKERGIHDLFQLARYGIIHTALIDLFHNVAQGGRTDRGKYLWMVDIIRKIGRLGAGRVHAWLDAVAYPNFRLSGLADLAEVVTLEEMLEDANHPSSIHLTEARGKFSGNEEIWRNVFFANFLGDYLFAFGLLMGSRLYHRGELDWKEPGSVAAMMRDTFGLSWRAFRSGEEDCLADAIDWERMGRQMGYYPTTAYVADFGPSLGEERKVPEGIYEEETKISFGDFRKGSWSDKIGWMGFLSGGGTDGKEALGAVNGVFPITELIKAVYLYSSLMATGMEIGGR